MSATVGCLTTTLTESATGATFPVLALYPSGSPERPEHVERFVLDVALDGAVRDGKFPLVVISHGTGGSHLLYRTLATHLARSGFVVVLPEHPGNNRNDNRLAGTHTVLADRPRQVSLVIDWAYDHERFAESLLPERVAVVGHSLGGYTALAIAGGHPGAAPHETPDGEARLIPVIPDPRVRAVVLLAPATPWFAWPGALQDVHVPIQMWTAEKDEATPPWHGEVVREGVRDSTLVEHHVVANAGHYSFLSPFPQAMTSPSFPPSQDPPGFDRQRFHGDLECEVEAFLRRAL